MQSTNTDDAGRGYFWMGDGTVTVTSASKAIDAVYDVVIDGGSVDLSSTGDTVEDAYLLFAGGEGNIASQDDAVNSTADEGTPWVSVSGGEWTLRADGDGLDSNGTAHMSGGTLFSAGSIGVDEAPSLDSPQTTVKFQTDEVSSELTITLQDSDGNQVGSWQVEKPAASFVISTPKVSAGTTYALVVDGANTATAVAGDYQEQMGRGGSPMGGGFPGGPPEGKEVHAESHN